MENFYVDKYINALKNDSGFSDFRIVSAYSSEPVQNPVRDTYIVLGIDSYTGQNGFLGAELSKKQSGTIFVKVYVSKGCGGESCHSVLLRVCARLCELFPDEFAKITLEKVEFVKSPSSYNATAQLTLYDRYGNVLKEGKI